jgi:glyoxylase-like metal-dependent hydrolase (beta-lactamase superfamily II)
MTIKYLTSAAVLLAAVVMAPEADTAAIIPAKVQAPGYFKMMIGNAEVTALYDGSMTFPLSLFKNATPATLKQDVADIGADKPKVVNGSVNSFLINTGDHLILIDSGSGKLMGPDFGQMIINLRAAGYRPEQVDTILLTHMHGDHIGGLVLSNGQPTFPNATVWASKPEIDFWLSQDNADRAPAAQQVSFQRARDTLAPYQEAGRLRAFNFGQDVLPGVHLQAIALPGHTPGHSGFMLEQGGEHILFWGDIVHYSALQFAHPDLAIAYDVDSAKAVKTRDELLKQVARQKTLIAGDHITFPGIGYVLQDGPQNYRWTPIGYGEIR